MSENLAKIKAPSESLFSKKNRKLLIEPLTDNNPVTVQVLGICSALAITVQLKAAIVMSLSVIAVMAASNVTISILRDLIPTKKMNRISPVIFKVQSPLPPQLPPPLRPQIIPGQLI